MAPNRRPEIPILMLLVLVAGCSSSEERVGPYARWSVEQQAQQNQQSARQSQEIAKTAKALVEADATARKEMIAAQRQLNQELHAERGNLNQQRDSLEQERRELADQRQREPVIAESIRAAATLFACLLPLLVAVYALSRIWTTAPDSAVTEVLIEQLASTDPERLKFDAVPGLGYAAAPEGQAPESDLITAA